MTLCIFFLPLCGQGTISIVAHTNAYISIVTYMTTFVYCDALIIDNTSSHVWDPMEVVFLGELTSRILNHELHIGGSLYPYTKACF